MAGSPTAAWLPKRPELAPADVSGPRFASPGRPTQTRGRATRPFRFGSENRPDPDPPLGIGSVIGDRYQIQRLLGEGGMGRVYEAQHIVLRRRVALKLLRRDAAAEPENLARFRQEALAASRIGAPEIVEVVDFASHPVGRRQQTYMVMELLAGESLEDWMDRNARLDEGLMILASLCDGLAAAHQASVVHRDIKPANVFLPAMDPTLASYLRVKILDFGIAKITAGGESFQTRQGALLGTPYYLAPERAMGAELTGAADLYSVGVILYEMLTGNVPFMAETFMGILANHVHTMPLDPRQAAPERAIPDVVAQLCMRLLDKEPRARPSAEDVAGQLRSLLARERGVLAAVVIGPREHSDALDVDTQVIAEGVRELPSSERPTIPPAGEPSGARVITKIGHAPAASSAALPSTPSVTVAAAPAQPAKHGAGFAIGLAATLGAAAIAALVWFGLSNQEPATEQPVEAPATAPSEGAIEEPAIEADPPPTPVEAKPAEAKPSEVPSDEKPSEQPITEREPRDAVDDRKRDRTNKQKSDPKPADETTDAPAPEPAPEPPPVDPPEPKPEPDPSLPTIKDDVYE